MNMLAAHEAAHAAAAKLEGLQVTKVSARPGDAHTVITYRPTRQDAIGRAVALICGMSETDAVDVTDDGRKLRALVAELGPDGYREAVRRATELRSTSRYRALQKSIAHACEHELSIDGEAVDRLAATTEPAMSDIDLDVAVIEATEALGRSRRAKASKDDSLHELLQRVFDRVERQRRIDKINGEIQADTAHCRS
jgi:hypothetical protein